MNSMHFTIPIPQNLKWVLFSLIFSFLFSLSFCDPRTSLAGKFCSTTPSSDKNISREFIQLMELLTPDADTHRYALLSSTTSNPGHFGLAQCYRDLSTSDCNRCIAEAKGHLQSCLPYTSGRVFLDGCFIRYDNYNFYDEISSPSYDNRTCANSTGDLLDNYMRMEYTQKVDISIKNVTQAASVHEGFWVVDLKGGAIAVYTLGQCWSTISGGDCLACLENAGQKALVCVSDGEARVMNAGCYLRYSTKKFYDSNALSGDDVGSLDMSPHSDAELVSERAVVIVGIGLLAVVIGLLSFCVSFIGYGRLLTNKQEQCSRGQIPAKKSNLNFKYEMLEKATEFFDPSGKLGEGGAGSVFKGTLPDGRTVAVKRLFFNTRQWVDEFFNEVNLISGIQHKNIVKLLGCSIEGPESLLVYEYVPNKSLDKFLFDMNKAQILSWQQRIMIIFGTADGLAYLHGGSGSQAKIIHRDIKCSNILLDENITPKIADFGLVRSVAGDKTHVSTGIAGTLGYMAPEYLVRGQLTEKADVYAFGVLVLEIVCGRKNSVFIQGSSSILQTVWKNYRSKKLVRSVDPSLKGEFSAKEASNVLQVGLLCTQASTTLRPSMSEVVQMLNDREGKIPSPKQPPFLNSTVLGSNDNTKSSSVNSFSSLKQPPFLSSTMLGSDDTTISSYVNSLPSSTMLGSDDTTISSYVNSLPSAKQPPFLNSAVLCSDDTTKSSSVCSLALTGYITADTSSTSIKSFSTACPEPNHPSTVQTSEPR